MVDRLEGELEGVVKVRQRLQAVLQEVEDAINTNCLLQDELKDGIGQAKRTGKKVQRECFLTPMHTCKAVTCIGLGWRLTRLAVMDWQNQSSCIAYYSRAQS